MDQYIVSARKYRPSTFGSVVGQQSITATLKNAIKDEHLAQAFLFTGTRGVGKTTTARILAKTINCFNRTPEIEACNECDSCISFNEGQSLNIFELDAASNNSVEDIRNLIDQVRMAPQIGSHKVYIIDEVHMLSANAFNAFLKTLEEPPAHAIFILATTEKHKIIPTILSRCQIFDFSRIRLQDMVDQLGKISDKEGVTAEEEVLHIISEKADGSLRDALSMFDQQVSFSGKKLLFEDVIRNLNILDYDYYFKMNDSLNSGDIPTTLNLFNEIIYKGFEGHQFINGMAAHLRNLMVCKAPETVKLLEVSENVKQRYQKQAKEIDQQYLLNGIDILTQADYQYKSSQNKRLLVELSLMQIASMSVTTEKKKAREYSLRAMPAFVAVVSPKPEKKIEEYVPEKPEKGVKPVIRLKDQYKKYRSPNSIEYFLKENEKVVAEGSLVDENKPATPFSQQQLDDLWVTYVGNHIDKKNRSLYLTLNQRVPVLKDGFVLEFPVENKVQKQQIEPVSLDLVNYLREKLNNFSIVLKTPVQEVEKEKTYYSAEERYKYLAEKFPIIEKLRKKLDLDIDY